MVVVVVSGFLVVVVISGAFVVVVVSGAFVVVVVSGAFVVVVVSGVFVVVVVSGAFVVVSGLGDSVLVVVASGTGAGFIVDVDEGVSGAGVEGAPLVVVEGFLFVVVVDGFFVVVVEGFLFVVVVEGFFVVVEGLSWFSLSEFAGFSGVEVLSSEFAGSSADSGLSVAPLLLVVLSDSASLFSPALPLVSDWDWLIFPLPELLPSSLL